MESTASFVIAVGFVAVWIFLAALPYFIAKRRRHSRLQAIEVTTFLGFFIPILWIAALIWAFTEDNRGRAARPVGVMPSGYKDPIPPSFGFEPTMPVKPLPGMPGKYKVDGVDKETQMDVTEYIDAQNDANARAKAELRGIVVTSVEWVPPVELDEPHRNRAGVRVQNLNFPDRPKA